MRPVKKLLFYFLFKALLLPSSSWSSTLALLGDVLLGDGDAPEFPSLSTFLAGVCWPSKIEGDVQPGKRWSKKNGSFAPLKYLLLPPSCSWSSTFALLGSVLHGVSFDLIPLGIFWEGRPNSTWWKIAKFSIILNRKKQTMWVFFRASLVEITWIFLNMVKFEQLFTWTPLVRQY